MITYSKTLVNYIVYDMFQFSVHAYQKKFIVIRNILKILHSTEF